MSERAALFAFLRRLQLWFEEELFYACARIGHRWRNVEENVAKCRVCGALEFGSDATEDQVRRLLVG